MYPFTPYPLTPIGSFIGFVLSVLPLVSRLNFRPWNTGIWMYAFWIGIMNIANFVDTIVWYNNVDIVIPVWCDIVTKLQTGAVIGVPACTLVFCCHLFKITRMRTVVLTDGKTQRRRALIFDLVLTLGIPLLIVVLSIVVQSYRFEIVEEFGCAPVAHTYIAYIIFYLPQVVLSLAAAALSPFILQRFLRHRAEMNELLSSNSNVTPNNYIRMMIITYTMLLFNVPNLVMVVVTVVTGLVADQGSALKFPHASWAFLQDGSLSVIHQVTAQEWGSNIWLVFTVKWNEWIYVLDAIFFFSIFGTTPQAICCYRSAISCILSKIGLKQRQQEPSVAVSDVMFSSNPLAPRRQPVRRGSLSFLGSSNTSGGHFTVSVRSACLMEEDIEELKSFTGAIEQSGGCDLGKEVVLLNSVQVAIPEETFSDSGKNI